MRNSFILGIMASVLVTLFLYALLYIIKFSDQIGFNEYMKLLKANKNFASSTLSLSLLGNIPLMYFLNRRKLFKTLYGVFVIIGIIGIFIIGNKFYLF